MEYLDYYEIGQKIKRCRINHGMSQEQAAELCDISASFYGNIERGTKKMSLDTFVVICDKLNLSPDYLLQDNLPDSDSVVFNIINEVKKSGETQYKKYLTIIKALAKIAGEL